MIELIRLCLALDPGLPFRQSQSQKQSQNHSRKQRKERERHERAKTRTIETTAKTETKQRQVNQADEATAQMQRLVVLSYECLGLSLL